MSILVQQVKPVEELTKQEAEAELARLAQEIAKHNYAYYNLDNPIISDAEYDELFRRNQQIEELHPDLIREDSPSLRVGHTVSGKFEKIEHKLPMLSLANAFSQEDIYDFVARIQRYFKSEEEVEFNCEPKIDGLSFSALYEGGKLIYVATRGDGYIGENITENMKTLKDFPHKLKGGSFPDLLEVRGEVYMPTREFIELNQYKEKLGEAKFANPRNAAAGSLRQLDSSITAERNLSYFIYGFGIASKTLADTQSKSLLNLSEFGFLINPENKVVGSVNGIIDYYEDIFARRANLQYDIDGTVYKVNSLVMQDRLGNIARSPRWAIAHKFPSKQAKTKLKDIIIQVGRTGALTPVALLEPVNIGGVMVSRCTLHNEDEIKRKDVRIGDIVTVQRAGDVIPQVIKAEHTEDSKEAFSFPNKCPECGSEAMRHEDEAVIRCINHLNCIAQLKEHLIHFVSRNAFNIDGLGRKQIEFLMENSFIKDALDIFRLPENNDKHEKKLQQYQGWGEKSVSNLFEAIEKAKYITLDKLIFALGIRHIGLGSAKILANHYGGSLANMLSKAEQIANETSEEYSSLLSINGIGEKLISEFSEFFRLPNNLTLLRELNNILHIEEMRQDKSNKPLLGKSLLFTGTLDKLSRAEAKNIAESLGAKVVSAVSGNTDYLIVGGKPGSKYKKALELNVKTLTEDEWMQMIEKLKER